MNFKKEKANLIVFFIISFVVSWLLWIPSVLVSLGIIAPGPIQILGNFAVFGPFISAFLLSKIKAEKGEVKRLFLSGWNFKFDKKWILALLIPIIIGGLTILLFPY